MASLHIPNLFTNAVVFTSNSFDIPFLSEVSDILKTQTSGSQVHNYLDITSQSKESLINSFLTDMSFQQLCKHFLEETDSSEIPNFEDKKNKFDDNLTEQGLMVVPNATYMLTYGGLFFGLQEADSPLMTDVDDCGLPEEKQILNGCAQHVVKEDFKTLDFFGRLSDFDSCMSRDVFLLNVESKIVSKIEVQDLSRRMLHCGDMVPIAGESTDLNLFKYVGLFSVYLFFFNVTI